MDIMRTAEEIKKEITMYNGKLAQAEIDFNTSEGIKQEDARRAILYISGWIDNLEKRDETRNDKEYLRGYNAGQMWRLEE